MGLVSQLVWLGGQQEGEGAASNFGGPDGTRTLDPRIP